MQIKGLVKTSIVDYPGKIAAVVFTGGCNFRCSYCHNADLVLRPEDLPDIKVGEVLRLLAERQGFVDGVVITGGEPTLQTDLPSFVYELKSSNLAIKLDTNGYCPQVLQQLLQKELLDYVAMDVKAPLEKYSFAVRREIDQKRIKESIHLVLSSEVEYEFRTTVVPGLVTEQDIEIIAQSIAGAYRYILQQFRPFTTLSDWGTEGIPYPSTILEKMANTAREWVTNVDVRGV